MRKTSWLIVAILVGLLAMGCGSNKKAMMEKDAQIAALEGEVSELEEQLSMERARAAELNAELDEALADYQAKEEVWLEQKESYAVVTASDAVMFNSGSITLSESGMDVIDKIAEVAANYPDREIRVEGHTDNVGIAAAYRDKYPSNWELATRRACSVVAYLMKKHEMSPEQLSAVGYGEYQPIAENETAEGRALNRRVVIVIGAKR
jgi:chemotaxis protein MotB